VRSAFASTLLLSVGVPLFNLTISGAFTIRVHHEYFEMRCCGSGSLVCGSVEGWNAEAFLLLLLSSFFEDFA